MNRIARAHVTSRDAGFAVNALVEDEWCCAEKLFAVAIGNIESGLLEHSLYLVAIRSHRGVVAGEIEKRCFGTYLTVGGCKHQECTDHIINVDGLKGYTTVAHSDLPPTGV